MCLKLESQKTRTLSVLDNRMEEDYASIMQKQLLVLLIGLLFTSLLSAQTNVATTIKEETHDFSIELINSRPDQPETAGTGQLEIAIPNSPETTTISWYEGEDPSGFIIGDSKIPWAIISVSVVFILCQNKLHAQFVL